jgi:hypothetical protein
LLLGGLLFAACQHGGEVEPTHMTSAIIPTDPVDSNSIDLIASGRCDREEKCAGIGEGRTFSSRRSCVIHLREDALSELTAGTCPGGVDRPRLDACLAGIQDEPCDVVTERLSLVPACRRSSLCLH